MPPSADTLMPPGAVFDGKFEIRAELGSGSFGRVYSARQLSTGQLVAVKVLRFPDDLSADAIQRQIERFQRETLLCAELAHPNIVALVDSGETEDGQLYVAFEHVPGGTLADLLAEEGRCKPREGLRLMIQVLDALAAAHRRSIVHRDLKPSNIMVSGTGAIRNAKLLDLGLGGFADTRRDQMLRVTQSREFLGTPLYSAPEQIHQGESSPRSDLYSWGLVCAECLTGRHPLLGEGAAGLFQGREIALPPGLADHRLGELLTRVTRLDPSQRDIDAETLVHELELLNVADLEVRLGQAPPVQERAERRQLTIISCRLEVASRRALDLEERDELMRRAHSVCETLTARHGGRLASKVGDRVMFDFGFPVVHESDARRAALAAIDIVEEMARLGERSHSRGEPHVEPHIGLHTGAVIARELRSADGNSVAAVVGATPAIANSLDEIAGPGEIVLSDTTRRLIEPILATTPIGAHPVRGLSGDDPLYRLLPGAKPNAALDGATRFVGREDELSQLEASWARAREGQARCVVVRGEAGIGKSRLVRELRSRVEGGRWLECRCLEETSDSPLRPVIDLLRSTGTPVEELLERYGFDVPNVAPLVRGLIGLSLIGEKPQISPERESQVLVESLASLLIEMSFEEPTALVVEDLHWADPTTRGLLSHLLLMVRQEAARGPQLLLLFTTREWAPEGASIVALPPLTPGDIVDLVRSGLAPAESLSPEILDLIVERSDGVPLFVEEVTRELRGGGRSDGESAADPIPDSLEALLQARLDTLSSQARDTTQVAAALGREFDYDLLRAVVADRSRFALDENLAELAREGFVFTRHTPGGQRYVFRHALIREAAYETMLKSARRVCHERIADALQGGFPQLATAEPQTLAYHLGEAGAYEPAAAAWHEAGHQAMARAAYEEAIIRFQKGLQGLERLPASRERLHREVTLLESLGMAYYSSLGYGAPQVEETFGRAESICEELGEHVPLQTLYGIWGVRFTQGDVAATEGLVSRFLELAEHSEEPLAALYAHGCHGLRSGLLGQLETADRELALSTAECEAPQNFQHIQALPYGGSVHPPAWWAWMLCWRGHVDRARDVCMRMHALDRSLANAYGHAVAGHFAALVAQELEDVDAAYELAEKQVAFSGEQKIVLWMLCSQCIRGWALARRGEPSRGILEIEQSLGMLRAIGFRTASSTFLARLADARLQAGDYEAGLASVKEGLALAETSLDRYYVAQLHRFGGLLNQALGDPSAAEAAFGEAIQVARAQGACWFELQAASDLARQLGDSGRREEGGRLLGEALSRVDQGTDTSPVKSARALLQQLA